MTRSVHTVLAGAALFLGGAAAAIGDPVSATGGRERPLAEIASEQGTTALEVAGWLRDRRPFEILDVRPAGAPFADFHLPRARHVPAAQLRTADIARDRLIVVYADGGDLAARAWVVLTALGHDSVRVLPDGVRAWLVDVVNPVLADDASEAARRAFAAQAELSRYFGGLPRIVPAGDIQDVGEVTDLVRRTTRRGCAF